MSTEPTARSWIEVDGAALRRNLRRIRNRVGLDAALIPMVKADAYGLGVAPAVRALDPEGPWGFGVATVEEGVELRELGVSRPVVVFTPLPPGEARDAVTAELTLAISDVAALEEVAGAARALRRRATVHIEVDSGMGRAGLPWDEADRWGPRVAEIVGSEVRWGGCFTHLHSADEAGGAESVNEQATRFFSALEHLQSPDDPEFLVHLCNSAGALRFPTLARQMVRSGIFLYGGGVGGGGTGAPEPEPVAALRSRIVLVRSVPPGTTLGYGATYRAERPERWATVGLGYGDGLRRALGNRGFGLVAGRRVPIIGRISMDMTVVDITGLAEVRRGDVVTFLGREEAGARPAGADGGRAAPEAAGRAPEEITLDEVAEQADTISYEILTGLSPRLPRVWSGVDDG